MNAQSRLINGAQGDCQETVEGVGQSELNLVVEDEQSCHLITTDVGLADEPQKVDWMKERLWSIPHATNHLIVLVTHTDPEQNEFYAQPYALRSVMEECSRRLNAFYSMLSPGELTLTELEQMTPGTLCATKWNDDDLWYRAEILRCDSDDMATALVRFIDYGNCDVVALSSLHKLIKVFSDVPAVALKCREEGLTPALFDEYFNRICGCTIVVEMAAMQHLNETRPEPWMVTSWERLAADSSVLPIMKQLSTVDSP